MASESEQAKQKVRAGIAAFKAGNRSAARSNLQLALSVDAQNTTALLWLAYLSDSFDERTSLFNKILAIDPENDRAQKGLTWAETQRVGDAPSFFSDETSPVTPVPQKKRNLWPIVIVLALVVALLLTAIVMARGGRNPVQSSTAQKSNTIVMVVETFTPTSAPIATDTEIAIEATQPLPSSTATDKPDPTATGTASALPTATETSIPPTEAAAKVSLPASTATATSVQPTATKTAVPPTVTATSIPPTLTATHTQMPPTATSILPTATSIPPSATSIPPTETPIPSTATSIPSTATPTETTPLPSNTATATPILPTEVTTQTPAPTATATLVAPTETATLVVPSPTPVPTALPSPTPIHATQKWIEVDLSDQTVVAWEGNVPVMNFIVSTGLPGTPTVVGSFHIYQKLVSTRMVGPGYDLPNVPHTMYFYLGYALHGAYWHNNFGHPTSHGCVNLALPDAERLFNWADPVVPAGAWSVYATADNPGSLVVVHY